MSHAARIAEAMDRSEREAEMSALNDLIAAVRADVEAYEAERNRAAKRYLYAPEGKKNERLKLHLEATKRALIAECRLSRLLREVAP